MTTARKRHGSRVRAFTEQVVIPTFTVDKGHGAPAIFELEETRAAYPRTVFDISSRSAEPVGKEYTLSVLESELLRVEVLGEVGGRVWRILDKTSGRNLLWTNKAIKPVDVGRRHGWIEGSIEFPFPVSNHGEDTLDPYRTALKENDDGSATVTVSSFDHFYRFWSSYDITVRPDDMRVEITARLYNPTLVRNRYQIWINGAVPASEDMQFIFPVDYIAGHGFSGVYPWPMWDDGKYDRSMWKNQKEMLGVFGWNADFLGVYYHGSDCGTIRYCPRTKAEGIKAWTWGVESRWTEEYGMDQGPCVEIQRGRWPTQRQYGWLEPQEMDSWSEYWYPVGGLGGVDEATADAAMSVKVEGASGGRRSAVARINVLRPVAGTLSIRFGGVEILKKRVAAGAGEVIREAIALGEAGDDSRIEVELTDNDGNPVISYDRDLEKKPGAKPEEPKSVKAPGEGAEWEQLESALSAELLDGDLDRAGEEYASITRHNPEFAAAWKALGILRHKQADAAGAKTALSKASALDGGDAETAYYLALSKIEAGDADAAQALKRAEGNGRYGSAAALVNGIETLKNGKYSEAAEILQEAAAALAESPAAWDYTSVAARLSGNLPLARRAVEKARALEPMDVFARVEVLLLDGGLSTEAVKESIGADKNLFIETAFFYDGVNESATALAVAQAGEEPGVSPLYYYQLGYFAGRAGDNALAKKYVDEANSMGTDYVFPHRKEDLKVLAAADELNGGSGYPTYHRGTLLYWMGQSGQALGLWEGMLGRYSVAGLYHKVAEAYGRGKVSRAHEAAITMYEKAIEEDAGDVEAYRALDDLYEKTGDIHNRRELVGRGRRIFPEDDELAIREARFWNWRRQYAKAAEILEGHVFHRRHQAWHVMTLAQRAVEDAYGGLAMAATREGREQEALEYLKKASRAAVTIREWFD